MRTRERILSIKLMEKMEMNPELGAGVIENYKLIRRDGEMARQIRSDCTVGTLEKRLGVSGVIRNKDGRDTRSDKKIGTLRKEAQKRKS